MGKRVNKNSRFSLKKSRDRSHNPDSLDERIIALVKLLARSAAEEDYRKCARHLSDKGDD